MNNIERLHRKIRIYCIENSKYWTEKYQEARKGRKETFKYTYNSNDYNIFPRYQALEALLHGVEEVSLENQISIETAKKQILEKALSSNTIFTKNSHGSIKESIDDEKRKFKEFVLNLTENDLINVPPLFYRRKLDKKESEYWEKQLKDECSVDFSGFWYPKETILNDYNSFLLFDEDAVEERKEKLLNELIKSNISNHYYIFNEDGVNYELEKSCFDMFNLLPEAYVFDNTLSWLIYYSHEDFYIIKSSSIKSKIIQVFPELAENMNNIIKNCS